MPYPDIEHRFKKGNPGGPGRGKVRSIEDRLKGLLEEDAGDGRPGDRGDRLAEMILSRALRGDGKFMQMLLERVSGKVAQALQHDGEVTIRIEYADADPVPDAPAPEAGRDPRE